MLRDITHDFIPKEMLDRPKKGFSVPLDKWMRGPLKEQLLEYSNKNFLINQGLFDAEYVEELIGKYLDTGDAGRSSGNNLSKVCWPFFVFQKWYDYYWNIL